jgi:hypothetical protein
LSRAQRIVMTYEFKFTEQNAGRASDFETKTLLYLLGIDQDRSEVSIVFIDCFNDITGADLNCESLWDFQSKNVNKLTPRETGKSLFTLFWNFTSKFEFRKYALFIPQPKQPYLNCPTSLEFGIENFGDNKNTIREGLVSEHLRRTKAKNLSTEEHKQIDLFLEEVVFIIDRGEKYDYVMNLVSFKDKNLKPKKFYSEIFDEIRSVQNNKKFRSIHNLAINKVPEALSFDKHLHVREITSLVITRLVGIDLFKRKAIPPDFLPEVRDLDHNDAKDLIQKCKEKISLAVFNKNSKENFWGFLESAISKLLTDPELSCRKVYDIVTINGDKRFSYLTGLSGVYLISLIKEGFEQ